MTDESAVEATAVLAAMATTRTIRRYTGEAIPDGDLATMLWHATRAASGSNRQPARYLVLRNGADAGAGSIAARRLLREGAQRVWSAKLAADGYTIADPAGPMGRLADAMQQYVDHLDTVPVVVIVCIERYRPPTPTEGASVYPAVQNLLVAARAMGYGGALNMFHQAVEADLRAALHIPDEVGLAATVTLGRPAGHHGPVRRRPLADVVFDGGWGVPATWAVDPPGTAHTSWRRPTRG